MGREGELINIGEDYIRISRKGDRAESGHFDPHIDKSCIESDYSDDEDQSERGKE